MNSIIWLNELAGTPRKSNNQQNGHERNGKVGSQDFWLTKKDCMS
ncbi:hypothetical protein [Brevibacillus formosus]